MKRPFRIKFSFIALFLVAFAFPAQARVRAHCQCRHSRTQDTFLLTVDFLSGAELSEATKDSSFHPTGAYAIVWLGGGKSAVVEFEGQYFSNPTAPNEVKKRAYQGVDTKGVKWALQPTQFSQSMLEGGALQSYLSPSKGAGQAQARPTQAPSDGNTYANGQKIREMNTYFYPNGRQVEQLGEVSYPNGQKISVQGRPYYPNGKQAVSQGQPFYPNGQRITSSSSLSSTTGYYFTEDGKKTSQPPRVVIYREKDWVYQFPVSNGRPVVTQYTAEWSSPQGRIWFNFYNGQIREVGTR